MPEYYDRDGQPITHDEWVRRFGDDDYKRVARDEVGNVMVSTVWLGLNHQFGDGPPIIFETLIMGGPDDGEMWRYTTLAEAEEGHARVLEDVRRGA